MPPKIDRIRSTLDALAPVHLELADESRLHSRGLETHYKAVIVSSRFGGLRALQRHQQVYRTLGTLMGEIHALALHTYTPDEWALTGHAPVSPRCLGGSKHNQAVAA